MYPADAPVFLSDWHGFSLEIHLFLPKINDYETNDLKTSRFKGIYHIQRIRV